MKHLVSLFISLLLAGTSVAFAQDGPVGPPPEDLLPEQPIVLPAADPITNPWLPITAIHKQVYELTSDATTMRIERTLLPGSREFTLNNAEVNAAIVEVRTLTDGALDEVALAYYAQGTDGTIYLLGKEVNAYAADGTISGHKGSWFYGKDTPKPGVVLPATLEEGDQWVSMDVPGITINDAQVNSLKRKIKAPLATYTECLRVKEKATGANSVYTCYAKGVGIVMEGTLPIIACEMVTPPTAP